MELIPYTSREGREIVLRHHNALVVRDPASHRLEIRGLSLTECPTCHQPLRNRSSSPERRFEGPATHDESYVNPNYFRMLRAARGEEHNPPPSPVFERRLTQPTLPSVSNRPRVQEVEDAEFVSSSPAEAQTPQQGARIRREAFSPNYFKAFFVEEKELGRGGKGVVLLVRHEIDGCQLGHFACKRVPVGDDHAWLEKVLIEVELLAKLSHPNLVSYRHVWLEDFKFNLFSPSVVCAFILQQYCNGGDLLRYVVGDHPKEITKEQLKAQMRRRSKGQAERPDLQSSQRRLSFEEIYSLFRDIVSGLTYLHASNYVHRDLKPSNCLLHYENGKLTCLISDFGEVQLENAVRKSTGTTGTISYCAPEVLMQDPSSGLFGNFTTKSDVFSLGMILYFLCFGRLPYRNANTIQEELEDIDLLRAEITDWKGFQEERRERPDLPPKLYHLLKRMLALSPSERPSAADVLSAMDHESNTGIPRRESMTSNPPLGLREHRIQSLDSPLVPGSPVPEPFKHRFRGRTSENNMGPDMPPSDALERAREASHDQTLQDNEDDISPGHSHIMAFSKSQDGFFQAAPSETGDEGTQQPLASPPLLMPPPSTFWGDAIHEGFVAWHGVCQFYSSNVEEVVFVSRLIMFLIKMASLARMCWPLTARLEIGVPLVAVAAMDLGMPHRHATTSTHGGTQMSRYSAFSRWAWGWKISSILLILHFVVVWAVTRWNSPCNLRWDYLERG